MSNHVILDYVRTHNISDEQALLDTYYELKFKAYLQETLRCTRKAYCSKWVRDAQRIQFVMLDEHLIDEMSDPAGDKIDSIVLQQSLRNINKSQYEVLRLYFFSDKTEAEISRERNVTRQAINNLKRKGLLKLRELLGDT